jgi:hypothetical protein
MIIRSTFSAGTAAVEYPPVLSAIHSCSEMANAAPHFAAISERCDLSLAVIEAGAFPTIHANRFYELHDRGILDPDLVRTRAKTSIADDAVVAFFFCDNSSVSLKLFHSRSGNLGMRICTNAKSCAALAAFTLFSLSVSLLADDTHWPLRVRGSNDLGNEYNNGTLTISFQPGGGPADNGLQPGQASWLDRGFRPAEPHQLQQTISEDEATVLITYLSSPDNYVTFYTAPGSDGYFGVFSSEPYTQGQQTSNEPRKFIWDRSVNVGRGDAGGQDGPVVIDAGGGNSVAGGGPRVFEHGHWVQKDAHHGEAAGEHYLEKEQHHGEAKVHETGGKEHAGVQKKHENQHVVRTGGHPGGGGHQVSLVHPVKKPLVKPAVAKVNAHPANNPKKKK